MDSPGSTDAPLLLDTSVFSLLLKPKDTRTELYSPDLKGKLLAISFITLGELYRWALQRRWGLRRTRELESRLRLVVVLPWSESVARYYARIQVETPKGDNDAWIAACALAYGCTLVTDDKHFRDIQSLRVITHS